MLHVLYLLTLALAALSAFAAVVRDVPILNVVAMPPTLEGRRLPAVLCIAFVA